MSVESQGNISKLFLSLSSNIYILFYFNFILVKKILK